MRKFFLPLFAAVLALALVTSFQGCASRLQPGGAYAPASTNAAGVVTATQAPDYAFFVVDSAFDLAYSTFDGALKFERDNRALLWKVSPTIKHDLDAIRPGALKARNEYALARAAYLLNPTPAGLSTLQTTLAKIQQVSASVQAALPK